MRGGVFLSRRMAIKKSGVKGIGRDAWQEQPHLPLCAAKGDRGDAPRVAAVQNGDGLCGVEDG
jgi:hypothetical protein